MNAGYAQGIQGVVLNYESLGAPPPFSHLRMPQTPLIYFVFTLLFSVDSSHAPFKIMSAIRHTIPKEMPPPQKRTVSGSKVASEWKDLLVDQFIHYLPSAYPT